VKTNSLKNRRFGAHFAKAVWRSATALLVAEWMLIVPFFGFGGPQSRVSPENNSETQVQVFQSRLQTSVSAEKSQTMVSVARPNPYWRASRRSFTTSLFGLTTPIGIGERLSYENALQTMCQLSSALATTRVRAHGLRAPPEMLTT